MKQIEKPNKKWQDIHIKDKLAYIMAIVLITSGIVMSFLCFFLAEGYVVHDSVLMYTGESFISGGGLLGVGLYVKNKFSEISNYIQQKLPDKE